ncbi:hypothetical protein TNCT_157711 [Trichonephila clavata]|uniref:Uncharacterized protein n=1 Tax=Trichonephila clavata TaxID=2740835 RepID=A0A8X6GJJ4_TRICU|nr:hypothetical protein TNCT_157711 [Trichonephila clavata]
MSSKSARRSTDYRRKKRHFCGNQHSKNETLEPVGIDVSSASSKKLCLDSGSYQSNSSESKGYRLINLDILLEELSKYLICFYCGSKAVLKEKVLFGLVSEFYIDCDSCAMQSTFKSSPVFESSNPDYEINTRITYAMRTLGLTVGEYPLGKIYLPSRMSSTDYSVSTPDMQQDLRLQKKNDT